MDNDLLVCLLPACAVYLVLPGHPAAVAGFLQPAPPLERAPHAAVLPEHDEHLNGANMLKHVKHVNFYIIFNCKLTFIIFREGAFTLEE